MTPLLLALAQAGATPVPAPDASMLPYADERHAVRIAEGRRIGLYCTGEARAGRPTVILTAGAGGWGVAWRRVQPAVARFARVCTWDRAGFGLSDPSPATQDVTATTTDLRAALTAGGVAPPYLLVGHSIGAYETLRFADLYRREVAGMVLAEPSLPDMGAVFARVAPDAAALDAAEWAQTAARARRCAALLVRLPAPADAAPCRAAPEGTPPSLAALLTARAGDPARHLTMASFFASMAASERLIARPGRDYRAMPLIVLTAAIGLPPPPGASPALAAQVAAVNRGWIDGHVALARLSTRGLRRTVANTDHMIPAERPDAIVAAVAELLAPTSPAR